MSKVMDPVLPKTKPKVKIDDEARTRLLNKSQEEHQVIVHCSFTSTTPFELIRIWKTTFLVAKDCNHKSGLIKALNISMFPVWTPVNFRDTINFSLIFQGLPKGCKHFDLKEEIPQASGFHIKSIARNSSDVYRVELT